MWKMTQSEPPPQFSTLFFLRVPYIGYKPKLHIQIYLVAGGCRQWDFHPMFRDYQCLEYLASTEVYRDEQWISVAPLPVAVMGVRGASLDNMVYMTGESSFN